MAQFKDLIGKTIIDIVVNSTNDQIYFECSDNTQYRMYHQQSCCENVCIEDICGDLKDLLNSPILKALEDVSNDNPEDFTKEYQESFTWTFYNLAYN